MSMIVELRKEQLKAELATLETAEQRAKTIASQLACTDVALNAASQLVTLNKSRLAEGIAELEALSKESAFIPQGMSGMRANHDIKTQRVDRTISELTAERDRLEGELRKKQYDLGKIVEQVAEHPTYKTTVAKQRALIAQAVEIVRSLFTVPLNDVHNVVARLSQVADAENRLLDAALPALREAGLPEIPRTLTRFVQQVTPHAVLDALPDARSQVFAAITQITEFASRGVVR
jgi:chromosome segregation ATPase